MEQWSRNESRIRKLSRLNQNGTKWKQKMMWNGRRGLRQLSYYLSDNKWFLMWDRRKWDENLFGTEDEWIVACKMILTSYEENCNLFL